MLNVIVATGRLTKDPELRKNAGDVNYVNFAIAIDAPTKNEDGEIGTCFLDCLAFNTLAVNIAQHLRKGDKVAVHGSLNQRDFLRKDGSKGRVYEIICSGVEFLSMKPTNEEPQEPDVSEIQVEEEPKYDQFTGKPLNKKSKK